jgi:hypothetical protein
MLSLLTRYKWGPFHFLIHKPKSDAAIFHQQKLDKVYDQNIQNHALQTYDLAWSYYKLLSIVWPEELSSVSEGERQHF